ncbi:MAG: class I SAM-dependent methyltransferase [Candidatus Thorarchaeota archaeon]
MMSKKKDKQILDNLKNMFEATYKKERSESYRNIFREVFEDDYPEEANPDSFVTITDLIKIVENLNVGPGQNLIDLGCGRGGPGLWLARETGANYIGIDLSENAIAHANKHLDDFKYDVSVKFQLGNMYSLDFPDESFDGAVSIDVIAFIPDPSIAILEVARVLRPKSYFVFTTWEVQISERYKDYRPYLQEAGFNISDYIETPDWEQRQREVYQKTLELKDLLIRDMGRDGAFSYIMEAKQFLPLLDKLRRILVVARKY